MLRRASKRLQAVAGVSLLGGLPRALFAPFVAAFFVFLSFGRSRRVARSPPSAPASDRWAYQTSIVRICGELGHRRLGRPRTDASVASRASALVKPLLRAAIVKLADMRLTSYSNGPGSVSSKSLRSNSSCRSGEANAPKFDRWASPQSCTVRPALGVSLQVGGHDLGRAPIERERRDHHPAVADRHEVGLAGRVLLLEQGDRDRVDREQASTVRGSTAEPALAIVSRVSSAP